MDGYILVINEAFNKELAPDDDPLWVETCCAIDKRFLYRYIICMLS
jgi:hypothetical protein